MKQTSKSARDLSERHRLVKDKKKAQLVDNSMIIDDPSPITVVIVFGRAVFVWMRNKTKKGTVKNGTKSKELRQPIGDRENTTKPLPLGRKKQSDAKRKSGKKKAKTRQKRNQSLELRS